LAIGEMGLGELAFNVAVPAAVPQSHGSGAFLTADYPDEKKAQSCDRYHSVSAKTQLTFAGIVDLLLQRQQLRWTQRH
jgi:hypothetical protein